MQPPPTREQLSNLDPRFIYKILTTQQHEKAVAEDVFHGSEDDLRDGFIHFSAASQVVGTLEKHFADVDGLVMLTVIPDLIGSTLKWEASRGGEDFPHLYGELPMSAVKQAVALS